VIVVTCGASVPVGLGEQLAEGGRLVSSAASTTVLCAVRSAGPLRVKVPAENWFVPLGSNRSGGRGKKPSEPPV
jgi:protein-L-isoaspartate O-methyltransferase